MPTAVQVEQTQGFRHRILLKMGNSRRFEQARGLTSNHEDCLDSSQDHGVVGFWRDVMLVQAGLTQAVLVGSYLDCDARVQQSVSLRRPDY